MNKKEKDIIDFINYIIKNKMESYSLNENNIAIRTKGLKITIKAIESSNSFNIVFSDEYKKNKGDFSWLTYCKNFVIDDCEEIRTIIKYVAYSLLTIENQSNNMPNWVNDALDGLKGNIPIELNPLDQSNRYCEFSLNGEKYALASIYDYENTKVDISSCLRFYLLKRVISGNDTFDLIIPTIDMENYKVDIFKYFLPKFSKKDFQLQKEDDFIVNMLEDCPSDTKLVLEQYLMKKELNNIEIKTSSGKLKL